MKQYTAVVERDADTGLYVGYVPGFPGAYTAASLDELNANLREVVAMLLEDGDQPLEGEFVGIQTVRVAQTAAKLPAADRRHPARRQVDAIAEPIAQEDVRTGDIRLHLALRERRTPHREHER